MIVVSDTSTLYALLTAKHIHLLAAIYGRVVIPPVVLAELSKLVLPILGDAALKPVQEMVEVISPQNLVAVEQLRAKLDAGESAAIILAQELRADFLLIDESKGRNIAKLFGLPVKGFVGVLLEAKGAGLIPAVKPLLDEVMQKINFRIDAALYRSALASVQE